MELRDLINKIDIVDYISQFVELEEKNGEYWGISPFTWPPEHTPSFSIRRETGSFADFSSGLAGNVFSFVRFYKKCSPSEAVKELEEYAGVDPSELSEVNDRLSATVSCRKYSNKSPPEKVPNPTILKENYMEKYENNPQKLSVWRDEGISDDVMEKFGVKYDSFSDRIVYPIKDISGNIVNIGGRTLDPLYKEHGLRKYCYFFGWGGTICTIYGVFENMQSIIDKHQVIIFEGCKSVLKASTWGITNTAAILTSHLSSYQMKILARLGCDVVFALDKDVDISADRHINRLKQYVKVEYIRDKDELLSEKDAPVDQGLEVFKTLYERRVRYR